ncbi:MAG TPA: peptidoglycan-binding protein [Clostridiaceae bacterium]
MPSKGRLQVKVYKGDSYIPINNARITIAPRDQAGQNYKLNTDSSGQTSEIEVTAPDIQLSMSPTGKNPYDLYDIIVEAPGFKSIKVQGCQVYPEVLALQECNMETTTSRQVDQEIIDILPNTLVGKYPAKIPEAPIKPENSSSGFVVLNQVVIPEFIVVHAGDPNDTGVSDYKVRYKNYIKNVASCEIFSTWPENTIRANILCIISFTLNRIYTEWYRNKGKNFQITSSTAYDHAFIYGRNIYANISNIVDQIFATYCKRPGVKQPLLTQYCDGTTVSCPNWLTQWGSKYLGDQGLSPIQILTHYYGTDLSLTTATAVPGVPSSYPGYVLGIGSSGPNVSKVQTYLNKISENYPAIPKVPVNGVYGKSTYDVVKLFQETFNLTPSGTVNYATWYKISDIYVAVTQIGELRGIEGTFIPPLNFEEIGRESSQKVPKVKYIVD